jgi:hypothetical protein
LFSNGPIEQIAPKELQRPGVYFGKITLCRLVAGRWVRGSGTHLDSGAIRQQLKRLKEGKIFPKLNERENVPALSAAETLEKPAFRVHGKRGRFFRMETTQTGPPAALPLKFYVFGYDLEKINPIQDLSFRGLQVVQRKAPFRIRGNKQPPVAVHAAGG